ncbi:hypothetical protein [Modestobacter roseus]|uniref:Uncharacterized protein n=1 Tax=Modestobacter roseus TaxID=1181884 RepID=A0A562ITU0_9ACTN|nr:hypothetical protein [Modestobacter roseus]MQA36147.1 hypothetical protein [Modestobacter roseus]TWH74427.1 hypothetical protein JD78_02966 [Modestobacter roseus]
MHPLVAAALQQRPEPSGPRHAAGSGGLGWPGDPADGTGLGWPGDLDVDGGTDRAEVPAEEHATPRRTGWRRLFGGSRTAA